VGIYGARQQECELRSADEPSSALSSSSSSVMVRPGKFPIFFHALIDKFRLETKLAEFAVPGKQLHRRRWSGDIWRTPTRV
jgi:hypothetical protein